MYKLTPENLVQIMSHVDHVSVQWWLTFGLERTFSDQLYLEYFLPRKNLEPWERIKSDYLKLNCINCG
ncbi:hypothetical protein CLV58_11922 [Spirosoma oryzae]|uniref:Uncharacterized protein n=1 Tax=Spirosoma oryzae TaxID=1469603 RepID=A0A2T0SKG3_9BACT|nr:hypothetical protein [Spirosoma oryzae]PRY33873.1 hypothetical protein CLV58_11922 [Spirosoma oryzae]